MCGIVGAFNPNGIKKIDLEPALKILHHRGPDSKGTFYDDNICLGHTRLSIIDLSKEADQPMIDEDLVIVFNGEIYNYREIKRILRAKGHLFKTKSDTEVILKAYRQWGERCVHDLEGMWAFCIYDKTNNSIFLSRDRIGEKPLVYYKDKNDGTFYFASELPALMKIAKIDKEIDYQALHLYFINNYRHIPANETIFENVFKLEPANNLVCPDGHGLTYRYWDIDFTKEKYEDWLIEYKAELSEAVQSRELSDVPIGILLSGGIDSSSIALYLKNKNITSYTLGFSKDDPELERASRVAKLLGIKNKQIIFSKDEVVKRALDINRELISNLGEPINLIQAVYTKLIMEEVRKDGIKVIIGGNGADELFYGYDTTPILKILNTVFKIMNYTPLRYIVPSKGDLYRYRGKKAKILYNNKMKQKLETSDDGMLIDMYTSNCNSPNFIEKSYYTGLTVEDEHSITIVADMGAMADSVELRAPFLHRGLMELSGRMPIKLKAGSFFSNKHNKEIMRKGLVGTPIEEITKYKKMGFGFGVDMAQCFKNEWKDETERLLFKVLPKMEVFDMDYIKYEYYKMEDTSLMWKLISLAQWYEGIILLK